MSLGLRSTVKSPREDKILRKAQEQLLIERIQQVRLILDQKLDSLYQEPHPDADANFAQN